MFQCLVWCGQQEGDKDCYECHNSSSQYQQFPDVYKRQVQHILDVFDALFCCLAGTGRAVSGSQAFFSKL